MDPEYELKRVTDQRVFLRKMMNKRVLNKLFGEIYVGRRLKLAHFRRWLGRIEVPRDGDILEAGSGDGAFAYFVARRFVDAKVTGLELNPIEASVCDAIALKEGFRNLRFKAGTLATVEWKAEFDLIYCLDVLEHIQDDVGAMQEMYDALRPGGSILIHVPNRVFVETDGRRIEVPDEEAWKINAGHVRHGYSPCEMRAKLEQVGFAVESVEEKQGDYATWAHRIYAKVEKCPPLRVIILPIIDVLSTLDRRRSWGYGNTVWAWARKA